MNELTPFKSLNVEVLEPVSNKKELRKYLDKENIVAKLNDLSPGKDKMFLITLWMTGLRVTEIISLRKRDLDFNNHIMTIRYLKSRKFFERIVPFKKELGDMLQIYTLNMKADDRLFPMQRARAWKITKKLLGISPHQLRHSFAVHYLRQGGRIEDLKRLLGHSNVVTTFEYLKIVPSDLAKELEKVNFG